MEELKIGDLVETCEFLPGFITSIDIDNDTVEVFIPGKHDFNSDSNNVGLHSIKHCGVHKIDSEYAMKLFLIGEARLKKLWGEASRDNLIWEEKVDKEYKQITKHLKIKIKCN